MKALRSLLVLTAVWWLMSGWAYSDTEQVIAGPFKTCSVCNDAGNNLPWQVANNGWHCESD